MSVITTANFKAQNEIHSSQFEVDMIPDSCPVCHKGMQPIQRFGWAKINERKLWLVFECPIHTCGDLFFSHYIKPVKAGIPEDIYEIAGHAPWAVKKEVFPEEVIEISDRFPAIYNQAKEAEERKLKEICGAGYRRALEFLIKDYLKKEEAEKPEIIEKTPLGTCIENYISSNRIKDCAKRAAWLGNDETHYIRKWEDKDLNDLKNIIKLTTNWIHDENLTRRIKEDMPEKDPKVT